MAAKKKTGAKRAPARKKKPVGLVVQRTAGGKPRGAIYQGAPTNPVAGPGRPRSELRNRLAGSFEDRIPILEEIADGRPTVKMEVAIASLLPHIACLACAKPVLAATPKDLLLTIEVLVSASPRDRIAALSKIADLGIGPMKEIPADMIREKLAATVAILRAELDPAVLVVVLGKLSPVWKS